MVLSVELKCKSEIMHFRKPNVKRKNVKFNCSNNVLGVVNHHRYLGIVLNEFLDYNFMAKIVEK